MKMLAAITTLTITLTTGHSLAQDAEAGEKIFKQCKSCHQIGDGAQNKTGPILTGVIGRPAASIEGFKYSKSMRAAGEAGHIWDAGSIAEYITNPTKYLRALLDKPRAKAKMRFKLKSEQDRLDVVAYLATFSMAMTDDMQDSKQMVALAPADTPGKICVTNAAKVDYLFIVETSKVRTAKTLATGEILCAETDQGGKVSVFENEDSLEGCTQLLAPNKSNTMVRYLEFDRCEWGSHHQ